MMGIKSFVNYSKNCDFPIENLPYGVFSTTDDEIPRIGVAIGDLILDLKKTTGIFNGPLLIGNSHVFYKSTLNEFMALGRPYWKEARKSLQSYLSAENSQNQTKGVFIKQTEAKMHVPAEIGDFTDFSSSYYHARNCSALLSIDLLNSNWKYLPIAYHGRSSSICVSGTPVKRPMGQILEDSSIRVPKLSASKRLDFELEMGVFLGGPLNSQGNSLNVKDIEQYIFGMVLLNDWSARDIQLWGAVPLGPFASKNFCTSVSPWIVTMEALEPFIIENMKQDPVALPYLNHQDNYNFDINLAVHFKTEDLVETEICRSNLKYLYWTVKQQLCHHAVGGCNMRPGDLLGTGTVSGPTEDSFGCLWELTKNGTKTITLANGKSRTFLEDGDEVILTGYCLGNDYRIGFGTCTGKILPNKDSL